MLAKNDIVKELYQTAGFRVKEEKLLRVSRTNLEKHH